MAEFSIQVDTQGGYYQQLKTCRTTKPNKQVKRESQEFSALAKRRDKKET